MSVKGCKVAILTIYVCLFRLRDFLEINNVGIFFSYGSYTLLREEIGLPHFLSTQFWYMWCIQLCVFINR